MSGPIPLSSGSAFGLSYRITRNPATYTLCGYVGVPFGHPYWGRHYRDLGDDIEVHGGLTFSAEGDDNLWWLGFDCAHLGDRIPTMPSFYGGVYRNEDYVRAECLHLAEQLKLKERWKNDEVDQGTGTGAFPWRRPAGKSG